MKDRYANVALTLSFELDKYLIERPHAARLIPPEATVVFQVDGNPGFNRWSKALARRHARNGQKVITVHVRSLGPPVSRIREAEIVAS